MMPNHSMLRRLWIASATLVVSLGAVAAPPDGVPGAANFEKAAEFSNQAFDRVAALQHRGEVHQWLLSEAVAKGLGKPLTANLSAQDTAFIDNAPRNVTPERVGLTKNLSASISFRDVKLSRLNRGTLNRANGAMQRTADGGFVFTTAVASPGATALRVHFTGFSLPAQTGLFMYTEDGQVFGPYTGRGPLRDGEFWSHTVMGDFVMLQLRKVGNATEEDLRAARFNVAGLGHIRPRFLGHCQYNESCVESAGCGGLSSAVNDAVDAVAHMQWISGPYIYICSGGLMADQAAGNPPYFLTANHCISRGKDARNLENFFQLTSGTCGTQTDCDDIFDHRANHPQALRTLGASIVSTGRDADYTLMLLNESAPTGSAFLGWTSSSVAFSNGTDLYRISHPSGAPQAYSEHVVDTSAGTCQSWPRGDRIYSRDTHGATEGGSSGSPVVNGSGQVVGQLSGACGFNVGDVCDSRSNATVDGAFAAYFSQVSQYLDNDGGCTPVTEVCDDGIDNDCDGAVDGNDSDCDQGGGDGLPKGEACVADNECASNKCTGKPGSMTCK